MLIQDQQSWSIGVFKDEIRIKDDKSYVYLVNNDALSELVS